jgi:type II restriction enzyme
MNDRTAPILIKSKHRVQKHGEVFTPQWVVDKMTAIPGIKEKTEDIFATFLEPSAGEGAFLLAVENLKLEYVTKHYQKDEWDRYALWALSSIYGIEFLDDNLEIARQNMLDLFSNYYKIVQGAQLAKRSDLYKSARTIIRANVVQGNTLTRIDSSGAEIVLSRWKPVEDSLGQVQRISFSYASLFGDGDISGNEVQLDFFDAIDASGDTEDSSQECYAPTNIEFVWREEKNMADKKTVKFQFDVVIGNPPYQESVKDTSDKPIYCLFIDEAYKIAERVSFITPARFLFNAGKTPKTWNQKMLGDEHLKVEYFEQDSSKVFSNTDIKGGVAVIYRDSNVKFGPIGQYTIYPELNSILQKIINLQKLSIDTIIYPQNKFNLDELYKVHPEYKNLVGSDGKEQRLTTSIFETLAEIFSQEQTSDSDIKVLGLQNSKRLYRWVRREYISEHIGLAKFKVFVPAANGSGTFGEVLSAPLIGDPLTGTTQTFLTVGAFDAKEEAKAVLKYICSKFARALLGVLKVTQHNTAEKWKYVPLQDFTAASDIDWSKSVSDIDRQLYKKYGLDQAEIEFIESHVKEMK